MPESPESNSPPTERHDRRLPATGLPAARDDRRLSSAVAIALHVLVIMLLIGPTVTHTGLVIERPQGAGGLGPAGGGGGGKRGTGGTQERVVYVRPATPPVATTPAAVIPPPAPIPQPKPPEVKPPEVKQDPTPPEVKPEVKAEAKSTQVTAPTTGTGGGTGNDGTNGTGPGSGGGVGAGVGTGRGSGTGPGTGGGVQENYPPVPFEMFLPPLPFPGKVRGTRLVAEFDVDETGKVVDFKFTSTGDRGYDKRLDDALKGTRFRPGTTPDGKPIRMKTQIIYTF
jgi:protein TonB